jgi:hypothetical protein
MSGGSSIALDAGERRTEHPSTMVTGTLLTHDLAERLRIAGEPRMPGNAS